MTYKLSKFLCFVLIVFYSQQSLGQNCRYHEYDSLVNVARKSFKNKKNKAGQTQLKLALKTSVFPRGEDLSFALYKAKEIKDDSLAGKLAEKLSKGGVPKRFFFQFKKEKWYPIFEKKFKDYSKFYHDNFNQNLRQELLLLLDKDKKRTERYHKWRTREIELSVNDLIDDAKAVLVDFEKIIAKYGFPCEEMIGYNYIRRVNKVEGYETDVLMIHMYQSGVRLFEHSILELICSGRLPYNFENTINKMYGFSDCSGIENEMKARYKRFRGAANN